MQSLVRCFGVLVLPLVVINCSSPPSVAEAPSHVDQTAPRVSGSPAPEALPCQAVLVDASGGQVTSTILSSPHCGDVIAWIEQIERLPTIAEPPASGKPSVWIHLLRDPLPTSGPIRPVRSVGVQTDVLKALNRSITQRQVDELRALFAKGGRPFLGTLDYGR